MKKEKKKKKKKRKGKKEKRVVAGKYLQEDLYVFTVSLGVGFYLHIEWAMGLKQPCSNIRICFVRLRHQHTDIQQSRYEPVIVPSNGVSTLGRQRSNRTATATRVLRYFLF
jgi:hypothetical protein